MVKLGKSNTRTRNKKGTTNKRTTNKQTANKQTTKKQTDLAVYNVDINTSKIIIFQNHFLFDLVVFFFLFV